MNELLKQIQNRAARIGHLSSPRAADDSMQDSWAWNEVDSLATDIEDLIDNHKEEENERSSAAHQS